MFNIFGIPMLLKRMVDSDNVKINSNSVFDNQFLFKVLDQTGFRYKIVGDVLIEHNRSYYVEVCSEYARKEIDHFIVTISLDSGNKSEIYLATHRKIGG